MEANSITLSCLKASKHTGSLHRQIGQTPSIDKQKTYLSTIHLPNMTQQQKRSVEQLSSDVSSFDCNK